jgi:hypothetical protein
VHRLSVAHKRHKDGRLRCHLWLAATLLSEHLRAAAGDSADVRDYGLQAARDEGVSSARVTRNGPSSLQTPTSQPCSPFAASGTRRSCSPTCPASGRTSLTERSSCSSQTGYESANCWSATDRLKPSRPRIRGNAEGTPARPRATMPDQATSADLRGFAAFSWPPCPGRCRPSPRGTSMVRKGSRPGFSHEYLDSFPREVDARQEELERLIEKREAVREGARGTQASASPALRPATPLTSAPRAVPSARAATPPCARRP